MDRRVRRSLELAIQFRNYRESGSRPWSGDFDLDTLSRIDHILTQEHHQVPLRLPSSEDPFPPAWPIDRSILNQAVKDFLRLTSHLSTPVTPSSGSAPSRPLGRPSTRSRASSQASSQAGNPQTPRLPPAADPVTAVRAPQHQAHAHVTAAIRQQPQFRQHPDVPVQSVETPDNPAQVETTDDLAQVIPSQVAQGPSTPDQPIQPATARPVPHFRDHTVTPIAGLSGLFQSYRETRRPSGPDPKPNAKNPKKQNIYIKMSRPS